MEADRVCLICGVSLGPDARADAKYCSKQHRNTAAKRAQRRRAGAEEPEVARLQRELEESRSRRNRLEVLAAQQRQKLDERDDRMNQLKAGQRRVTGQAADAVTAQTSRIVTARSQIQQLRTQIAQQDDQSVDRSVFEAATAEVTELRDRIKAVTARYEKLSGQYEELYSRYEHLAGQHNQMVEQVRSVRTEREQLAVILRQWDHMAGRLAKSLSGRTPGQTDRQILTTWKHFKQNETAGTGDRTRPSKGTTQ